MLGKAQPLLIVSSDLHRAYDTAVRLGERTGLPVRVDRRLRETHLGDWQGLTHTQVDTQAPGAQVASSRQARRAPGAWVSTWVWVRPCQSPRCSARRSPC
ncbi:hypothetical protein MAHJHV59_47530 [Mycobacterium avium subsp. hominissuis]